MGTVLFADHGTLVIATVSSAIALVLAVLAVSAGVEQRIGRLESKIREQCGLTSTTNKRTGHMPVCNLSGQPNDFRAKDEMYAALHYTLTVGAKIAAKWRDRPGECGGDAITEVRACKKASAKRSILISIGYPTILNSKTSGLTS